MDREALLDQLRNTHGLQGDVEEVLDVVLAAVHGQSASTEAPAGWLDLQDDPRVNEIVSGLYRRFKDWSQRGFSAEDVTWCEVKADVIRLITATAPAAIPAAPSAGREVPIAPDECPITKRKFWGNMEHPERGMVALYGGPYDSFTIPERCDDDELRSERYDQDAGEWVEGGEPVAYVYAEQQEGAALAQPAPVPSPTPKRVTPEMRKAFRDAYREGGFWTERLDYALDRMIEAAPVQQEAATDATIDKLVDDFKAAARSRPTAANGYNLKVWDELRDKLRAALQPTQGAKGGAS